MKNLYFYGFSLLILLSSIFPTIQAQTADEVITTYVKNIGGKEAWKKVEVVQMKGTSETQMGSFPTTIVQMKPNLMKVEVNIQGMFYVEGYDGEIAWTNNPFMGGVSKKTEADTKAAAKEMLEPELLDYQNKGHKVELVGTEDVLGKATHKLKLTTKDGVEKFYFFDKETGLPILLKQKVASGEMVGQQVDVYLSEYKEVNGIKIPSTIDNKIGGQSVLAIKMKEITVNPAEVTSKTFAYPGQK